MWEGNEQIEIDAPPERVWAVITDVERHPELAGSGEVRTIRIDGPLAVGTEWEAEIGVPKIDDPFMSRSRVIALAEPSEFVWTSVPLVSENHDELPLVTWSFVISPSAGGCTVAHTCCVDAQKVGADEFTTFFMETLNRPPTILAGMRKTL